MITKEEIEQINVLTNVYTNLGHAHFPAIENEGFSKEKIKLAKLVIKKLNGLIEKI